MRSPQILIFLALFVCVFQDVLAKEKDLAVSDIISFYLKYSAKIDEERDQVLVKENLRYQSLVERRLKSYQKHGNLEAALLAKKELDHLSQLLANRSNPSSRPTVDELSGTLSLEADRKSHDVAVSRIMAAARKKGREAANTLIDLLEKKMGTLTKEGKLEDAKTARDYAAKTRKEFPIEPKNLEESLSLKQRLMASRWTYHDEGRYSKDSAELELKETGRFTLIGREGSWKVKNEKARVVELSMEIWPRAIEIKISEDFRSYDGTYLVDGSRRHGKLLKGRK
ncbi:hypothetical protein N8Z81_02595 [Akkermansiaceae bacterium]|nr:hypothetical protein [Akkermansiaceae bacterium]